MPEECCVIQVNNVAPTTTKDQMSTLFGFIGKTDEVVLYPLAEITGSPRVCFVKFEDPENVGVALHLSNTVFIDRALVVLPVPDGIIPDERTALLKAARAGLGNGLDSTEETKEDEIRRTVYVANLDSSVTPEMLLEMFGAQAGEIKYVRMAGDEGLTSVRAAFIEFTEQVSVMRALSLTGQMIAGCPIRVVPATAAISKKFDQSGQLGTSNKDIEEAMRKVNEAQPLISAALDPDSKHHKTRSRSRSKSHRSRSHRSRSHRSRSHRSRSRSHRSRSRRRSRSHHRSRSRSHRRRSKSPRRRRSRSPRRHRSRSRSRDRRRHRSRSRSPRPCRSHRSKSPDKAKRKSRSKTPIDKKRSNRDVDRVKKESSSTSRRRSKSPGHSSKKRSRSRSKSASRVSKRDGRRDRSNEHERAKKDRGSDRDRSKKRDDDAGAENRRNSDNENSSRSKKLKSTNEDREDYDDGGDDRVNKNGTQNDEDPGQSSAMEMSDGNESD